MKHTILVLAICFCLSMADSGFCQSNKNNPKNKKSRADRHHAIDSSAVKVYLEYICTIDKDGTVRNSKGESLGKMQKDGLIKNEQGNVIGRREKTQAEINAEAIKNTY